jgi:hypothetical protein
VSQREQAERPEPMQDQKKEKKGLQAKQQMRHSRQ